MDQMTIAARRIDIEALGGIRIYDEWMNEYMYEQRVCVFIQATYTIFAFNVCSSVEEELQGREMPFLGGNPQSGNATLTETI